jgi:hypothetical protein
MNKTYALFESAVLRMLSMRGYNISYIISLYHAQLRVMVERAIIEGLLASHIVDDVEQNLLKEVSHA